MLRGEQPVFSQIAAAGARKPGTATKLNSTKCYTGNYVGEFALRWPATPPLLYLFYPFLLSPHFPYFLSMIGILSVWPSYSQHVLYFLWFVVPPCGLYIFSTSFISFSYHARTFTACSFVFSISLVSLHCPAVSHSAGSCYSMSVVQKYLRVKKKPTRKQNDTKVFAWQESPFFTSPPCCVILAILSMAYY